MFQPGSEFSRIILGAHNYFRTIGSHTHPDKERVLSLLERSDMMLGIRADPALSPDDSRLECVLLMAEALKGMIFDGRDMLDHGGRVVFGPGSDPQS